MHITAIKTHKITAKDTDIFSVLDRYIAHLPENSVVSITSKIVAICEGRIISLQDGDKDTLVKQEADFYLPKEDNKYGFFLTIKNDIMIASAGIDESNGNGYFVLWPQDPQKSANAIRHYLMKKFGCKNLGVIITDSKVTPLKRGVTGVAIAHSGFSALNNYIGEPDIFGHKLEVTKTNIAEGLAASAVVVMGEGKEQTPIAIITDIPFVHFQKKNPTKEELAQLHIPIEEDVFASILLKANWRKGNPG